MKRALLVLVAMISASMAAMSGAQAQGGRPVLTREAHERFSYERTSIHRGAPQASRNYRVHAFGQGYSMERRVGARYQVVALASFRFGGGGNERYGGGRRDERRGTEYWSASRGTRSRTCPVELSVRRIQNDADVGGHLQRMAARYCPFPFENFDVRVVS